jgi:hypothetical protein
MAELQSLRLLVFVGRCERLKQFGETCFVEAPDSDGDHRVSYRHPSGSETCQPFISKTTSAAFRPARLLPSTKAWLSAM